MSVEDILESLYALAEPEKVAFKAKKFGVVSDNSLGIYHKDLKVIAKDIGKNSELAITLFDQPVYEAKLLCSKIFNPKDLTFKLVNKWAKHFNNWEICDSFSMGLFAKSPLALQIIDNYKNKTAEFEKRICFATMAAYCMADKKSDNALFESFLPLIIEASNDERLYVKKAVNWALRSIGKRNIDLNQKATATAYQILALDTKAAKWIAKDALRELEGENVKILDYPRSVYRPN